jgi:hypothetical protein
MLCFKAHDDNCRRDYEFLSGMYGCISGYFKGLVKRHEDGKEGFFWALHSKKPVTV